MDNYKKLPLWKNAYYVGKAIQQLTKDVVGWNTFFRILQEQSEALPVTIAIGNMNKTPTAYAGSLRTAYDQAHDIEYLLFLSLIFRDLEDEQTRSLVHRLHAVKRDIVVQVSNLNTEA